ncbi:hypothetical protein [Psychrobacter namhaensis]|uniref:hypothetical protein n=1 Tax=Psychrobacter namhaensis TaxID=292734 RepID=UPI0018E02305|nr:hypothetical protein [Psychrobacter namhaensis]
MKSNNFNYSLLAVGVAAVMGISTGANAAESTEVSADAEPIVSKATATYTVSTNPDQQQTAESNEVTVNVSETANFSLVAVSDTDNNSDTNANQLVIPGGTTKFDHILTNTGNVTDTYTVTTTGDDTSELTTATPDYALGTSDSIAYTIVQSNGDPLTPDQTSALNAFNQVSEGTLTNGGTIQLSPGLRANLSYEAATPINQIGNDKGVGTLTATSAFFTTVNAAKPTLVNENQTLVKLPVFKIEKTAVCGTTAPCSTLDLTAATPTIDYSIKVTNVSTDYSDTATSFIVRDILPLGMTLNGTVTASGATVTSNARTEDGRTIVDITVPSLAVGANQVISFKVDVDKTKYTKANSSATNHATVYDKFDSVTPVLSMTPNDTEYDIVDSTDDSTPTLNTTKIPTEDSDTLGADTTPTISFTRRVITLASSTTLKEIAPITVTDGTSTDGQVTYQVTITNKGQDTEGNADNPLTFIVTDGSNEQVNPVGPLTLVYNSPDGTPTEPIQVEPTVNGKAYTIVSSLTGGIGIAPGGAVTISYNMGSTDALVGSSETTTVKLTASGNGAPTNIEPITHTTYVKGLTLDKFQALDINCDGIISGAGEINFTKDPIEQAEPDQCVIYRIDAKNTSSTAPLGFDITNLLIADATSQYSTAADYVANTAKIKIGSAAESNAVKGTPPAPDSVDSIYANVSTLAPQGTATLSFRVKIKNNR